ncbi:Uncharacterised protein [Chlamydia trachomatis]|nr:Uncharacterised protein [Chlamydia trachomatis]
MFLFVNHKKHKQLPHKRYYRRYIAYRYQLFDKLDNDIPQHYQMLCHQSNLYLILLVQVDLTAALEH